MLINYNELKKLDEIFKYLKYHNLARQLYHEITMCLMEQFRDVTITMDAVCKREHSIHKIAGNIIYELAKLKVISIPEVDEEARKFYDKVDEEEKQEEKELINEISVNKHIVCDSCAENLYVILQDIRQYCANNNRNMIIYGEAIDYIIAAIDKRVKEQTEGKS